MHDFSYYLHIVVEFFRQGFREGFDHVNAGLGLIIAVIAALLMPAWRSIWAIALGATLIHLITEVMLPVFADHERFRLPPDLLRLPYWRAAAALYLGYLVVIAIFYFVKSQFVRRGRG